MQNNIIHLTTQGLADLQEEYQKLTQIKKPEALEQLEKARSMGDLSENEAYQQAQREKEIIEGRIEELEDILKRARVVENNQNGIVQLGSRVKVHLDGEEQELLLVDESEADISVGKVSHTSPIGQALLGKTKGDSIQVEAPIGKITYTILEVK